MRGPRTAAPAALLLVLLAVPASAQDIATLADHRFIGGSHDSVAVELDASGIYRLEHTGRGGAPELMTIRGRRAYLDPVADSGAGGTRAYLVYPTVPGTYWVRLPGLRVGETGRVRIWPDRAAVAVRDERRAEHRRSQWAFGGAVSGGVFSAYTVSAAAPENGGIDGDGCLLIMRSGLGLCLGAAFQPRNDEGLAPTESRSVTWIFLEPRVEVVRAGSLSAAATLRVAQGSVSGPVAADPSLVAPGVLVSRTFGGDATRRGLAVNVSASYGFVGNVDVGDQQSFRIGAGASWLF